MELLLDVTAWLSDPVNWQGSNGVPARLLEHLWYSGAAAGLALAIALPIGVVIGHTGRGGALAINIANIGRAVPSFGIIILFVVLLGIGFVPALIALVAFAIPPVLTNTYAGIRDVDPQVRDAAEGMGMRPFEVLTRVELPLAIPLIMAGIRTSVVQTIATATLAAYVGLGGLGRYIINGLNLQDFARVISGALLVAALALTVEVLFGGLQRTLTSRGLRDRDQTVDADSASTEA